MSIDLPISKSIANRLLILQAIHGDELMPVSAAMPEDVVRMHDALSQIQTHDAVTLDVGNAGTVLRFLTAYTASIPGKRVTLIGSERMQQRPIAPLVDTLRQMGADIQYTLKEGQVPLLIHGCTLDYSRSITISDTLSSQFASALLLIGANLPSFDSNPYIILTREMVKTYPYCEIESDWSAAAFWFEFIALHGGECVLNGLQANSLQGDKVVTQYFAPLGVNHRFVENGLYIYKQEAPTYPNQLHLDFTYCPDLYPAIYMTAENLHIPFFPTGIERLPYKESNRIQAMQSHQVRSDHRVAMALLAADYSVEDVVCIRKSYPNFYEQLCRWK